MMKVVLNTFEYWVIDEFSKTKNQVPFSTVFSFYFHNNRNVCLCNNRQHAILTLMRMRNVPVILKGNILNGIICPSICWKQSSHIWRSRRNIMQVWWVRSDFRFVCVFIYLEFYGRLWRLMFCWLCNNLGCWHFVLWTISIFLFENCIFLLILPTF